MERQSSIFSQAPTALKQVTTEGGFKLMASAMLGCWGGYLLQPIPDTLNEQFNQRSWQSTGKWLKVFMLSGLVYYNYPDRSLYGGVAIYTSIFIAMLILFLMDVIIAVTEGVTAFPGIHIKGLTPPAAAQSSFRSNMKSRRSNLGAAGVYKR
jgi:hypothetical protein